MVSPLMRIKRRWGQETGGWRLEGRKSDNAVGSRCEQEKSEIRSFISFFSWPLIFMKYQQGWWDKSEGVRMDSWRKGFRRNRYLRKVRFFRKCFIFSEIVLNHHKIAVILRHDCVHQWRQSVCLKTKNKDVVTSFDYLTTLFHIQTLYTTEFGSA